MRNGIEAMITDITATTAEAEDYTGEDGLLYCGKCHTPKEAYFSKETAQWLGHDRHPTECDCQRAAREKREAAESRQKHLETVEDLKRRGFTDPAMRNWTFEHALQTAGDKSRPQNHQIGRYAHGDGAVDVRNGRRQGDGRAAGGDRLNAQQFKQRAQENVKSRAENVRAHKPAFVGAVGSGHV